MGARKASTFEGGWKRKEGFVFFSSSIDGKSRGAASEMMIERRRTIPQPSCPGSSSSHRFLSAPSARSRRIVWSSMAIGDKERRERGAMDQGRALFFFFSFFLAVPPLVDPSNFQSPSNSQKLLRNLTSPPPSPVLNLPCKSTREPSAARAHSAGARCRPTCRA